MIGSRLRAVSLVNLLLELVQDALAVQLLCRGNHALSHVNVGVFI